MKTNTQHFQSARSLLSLLVSLLFLSGCLVSRTSELAPDEQYGHRFDEETADGRRTMALTAPDTALAYLYYPTPVDTVHVRIAPYDPEIPTDVQEVAVEILAKGGLPDACSELHQVEQSRTGHILNVNLDLRRPKGVVCATVIRPYRFYLKLDGTFGQGAYTLRLNDRAYNFEIRAPVEN